MIYPFQVKDLVMISCDLIIFTVLKISKKTVDNSQPDTALPYLKFKASFKENKEVIDLELSFIGMREKRSLVIASYDLQQIKGIELRQFQGF